MIGHDGSQALASGRVALRWIPTEKLEVNVEGNFTNDHSGVQANTLLKFAPGSLGSLTYTAGVNGAPVFFGPQFIPTDPFTSFATYSSNACSVIFGCDPYAPINIPARSTTSRAAAGTSPSTTGWPTISA